MLKTHAAAVELLTHALVLHASALVTHAERSSCNQRGVRRVQGQPADPVLAFKGPPRPERSQKGLEAEPPLLEVDTPVLEVDTNENTTSVLRKVIGTSCCDLICPDLPKVLRAICPIFPVPESLIEPTGICLSLHP